MVLPKFKVGDKVTISTDLRLLKSTKWFNEFDMPRYAGHTVTITCVRQNEAPVVMYNVEENIFIWAENAFLSNPLQVVLCAVEAAIAAFVGVPNTTNPKALRLLHQVKDVLVEQCKQGGA